MSAVLPAARPLEAEGAALTPQHQHQHQLQHQPSSSVSSAPPPLPSRNLRRTSCFLDVLLDTTKSAPAVVTATLATASTHDVYLSSEEDASSFSSDMSDYNSEEEDDDERSSSTSTLNSSCANDKSGGGAALHASLSAPTAPPSSSPSAARRGSRDATARAVSVVFAGKPSLVDLAVERETRRRSVPSLRAAAAAAAAAAATTRPDTRGRRKNSTTSTGPLRIITEDLPSRQATASPIARPASASPYMSTATTPTLTPRGSLLFRGVSRTLTLSRRLGRGSWREETTRDEIREGNERSESRERAVTPVPSRSSSQRTIAAPAASASSSLPPRSSTPLSALFISSSPASSDEEEQQQKRRRKADAYMELASGRPASAHLRALPRSQTTSILAAPAAAGPSASPRKDNIESTSRFLGNFSGRRRSMKLL